MKPIIELYQVKSVQLEDIKNNHVSISYNITDGRRKPLDTLISKYQFRPWYVSYAYEKNKKFMYGGKYFKTRTLARDFIRKVRQCHS